MPQILKSKKRLKRIRENPIFWGEAKKAKKQQNYYSWLCHASSLWRSNLLQARTSICMVILVFQNSNKKAFKTSLFFLSETELKKFRQLLFLLLKQGFLSQSQTIKILCSRFLTKTVQDVSYMPFKPKPNHQNTLFEIPY